MGYKEWANEVPHEKVMQAAHIKAAKGMEAAGRCLGLTACKAETLFNHRLTDEERQEIFGTPRKKAAPAQKIDIEFDASESSEQMFCPKAKYVNLSGIYD